MLADLDKRFDDPPHSFSPVPIWWWSGEKLDAQRLCWQLERFAEGGVYNLLIMNLAPSGPLYGSDPDDPPFFSEEWWTMFRGVCEDARALGIHLWFYDQFGFSGANMQARLVTQHPTFAGQSLERVACDVAGTGVLECPEAGTPLAASIMPIDGQGQPVGEPSPVPVHGKSVTWQGSGTHRLMLFYSIESGFDYFNVSACQALLAMVHGAYEAHVGDFFGTVIVGTFQDELAAMPRWSRDFAQAFRARCGYDVLAHLPALWEDYGEQAQRVRHDYHATRCALGETALFKPLFQWHEERGLICGFDQQGPARAGYPIQSVQLYADYPRTHRWYTAPGSDHHGEAKFHSSLAHLYNRPRVWIEAFHSSGWGGTLEETFDWLLPWIRAGATLYDPHAVYYSTRGGWWEWAPPSTDWRQPYWKHYHVFAQTVSRLCSVLTLGHHVCDIGVLFPATTVQAGVRWDGFTQDAQTAHDLYLRLVGKMHWYKVEPGALDRACRDFDVLDDASIQRGQVRGGRLHIGEEHYGAIVLPGCSVLEDETAAQLVAFVEGGGTLVAVGRIPHLIVGTTGGGEWVQQLTALFELGRAHIVNAPEEVVPLLAAVPAQIEAAVPTLVRRIGQATVVFVPAVSLRATRMRSEEEAGAEVGQDHWLNVDYTFDPSTYHRVLTVRVRGVQEAPELWEPCSGRKYLLEAQAIDGGIEVHVPFDDSPGVLLVWPGEQDAVRGESRRGRFTAPIADLSAPRGRAVALPEVWEVNIEPTLDNRWGDFALPATTTSIGVERWVFRHMVDASGQAGLNAHWFNPEWDDSDWPLVHATFGPHGLRTGPIEPERLPAPLGTADEWGTWQNATGEWREAVYSLSRGIYKDPLHQGTLGPKGHVPEEFLDFGLVRAGEAVQFRTTLDLTEPLTAYLALGAPAQKTLWVNGSRAGAAEEDKGYLFFVPVTLRAGLNLLEFRLQAEADGNVRAHFAVVTEPTGYGRPEWVQARGTQKDTLLTYTNRAAVPFRPQRAIMYVATAEPCRVRVNGVEVGVQGGFDPYPDLDRPHIQRYDLLSVFREGENLVELEVTDLGASGCLLVDALIESDGSRIALMSNEGWQVTRNGRPTALSVQRKPWLDMNSPRVQWLTLSSLQVWQRPHPLPATSWLENASQDGTVLALVPDVREEHGRIEWLRFVVPPGAVRMHLRFHGGATVYLDGVEQQPVAHATVTDVTVMEVNLPHPTALRRVCALRVETRPGYRAGGILDAPVCFEMATGVMKVGSWEEQGLVGYSGGVQYGQALVRGNADRAAARTELDLGRVRGTAEVHVNGELVGVRIWSPYVFDLTDHLRPGENELHVSVYNTLGPYLEAISPTSFVFPGQTVSGLFGPVTLIEEFSRPKPVLSC